MQLNGRKIEEFMTEPESFLQTAHSEYGFDDQLIALFVWCKRSEPVTEMESLAEKSGIPFPALIKGLFAARVHNQWSLNPLAVLMANVEGFDFSAFDGILTEEHKRQIEEKLAGLDCGCGNCENLQKTELIH